MTTATTPEGRATSEKPHHYGNRRERRARQKAQRQENRRRAKDEQRRLEDLRRAEHAAKVEAERRRELAYYAKWRFSKWPGTSMPHHEWDNTSEAGRELTRIWQRMFESWQKFRKRFLLWHSHGHADREIIVGQSLFYRDMRLWMLRRCGWPSDSKTLKWWNALLLMQQMAFIDDTRKQGLYVPRRQAWQRMRRAA